MLTVLLSNDRVFLRFAQEEIAMNAKMSAALSQRLQAMERTDPHRPIPVIVTIAAGTDRAVLEQAGLRIERAFENISAVSGAIAAAKVKEVAQLAQVERIEEDGAVWALEE
jgi:hypothetical protein